MLESCGKSLMTTTFLSVKVDRIVESTSQSRRTVASGLVLHVVELKGLLSDDVITRSKEWRVAGLFSHDISSAQSMSTR